MAIEDRWRFILTRLSQGESQRAIARELGCDERTIRREIQKMRLPKEATEAIKQGYPAEPLFIREQVRAASAVSIRRIEEEQASGIHSRRTANVVVRWLLSKQLGFPNTERIIATLEYDFWPYHNLNVEPLANAVSSVEKLEPGNPPQYGPELMEYCLAVLREALRRIAREKLIRDASFPKMLAILRAVDKQSRRPPLIRPPRRAPAFTADIDASVLCSAGLIRPFETIY